MNIDQFNKQDGNIWIISNGGRTGSHYLCHTLNSIGFNPHFGEKYNYNSEWFKNFYEPLETNKKYYRNTTFPKFLDEQNVNKDFYVRACQEIIKDFPNTKFIYSYRRDIIAQLTSFYFAGELKCWIINNKNATNQHIQDIKNKSLEIKVNREKLRIVLEKFIPSLEFVEFIRTISSHIPCIDIYYEDMCEDKNKVIKEIFNLCGIKDENEESLDYLKNMTVKQSVLYNEEQYNNAYRIFEELHEDYKKYKEVRKKYIKEK